MQFTTIDKVSTWQKFTAVRTGTKHAVRAMKEADGRVFVFAKGKRNTGARYSSETFCSLYHVLAPADKKKAWERRVDKVIGALDESGLWPEYLKFFRNLKLLGHDNRELIRNTYQSTHRFSRSDMTGIFQASGLVDRYPFAFRTDDDGEVTPVLHYLSEIGDAMVKSMYFGKSENSRQKERIRDAIASNTSYYSGRIPAGYDVSFEYHPEEKKAWYSEEYRNCGNGYYYIALNDRLALFVEKD